MTPQKKYLSAAIIIVIYLAIINFIGYTAFFIDKRAAQKREQRISENSLLFIALIGGTSGCFAAQQKFRHKTRKQPFKIRLQIIAALQVIALTLLCIPSFRSYVMSTLT